MGSKSALCMPSRRLHLKQVRIVYMTNKNNSPYSAAITGCAFLYTEFLHILPLLMNENSSLLLREEVLYNKTLHVNSQKARQNFITEFKRRYDAVPASFWRQFVHWHEPAQRAGLLYAILKAYKLAFDFHFNVTVKRWNSAEQTLCKNDLMMEFSEISSRDSFVDGWTENTKGRCASQYLTILHQAGLLQAKTDELHPIRLDKADYTYYVHSGEEWFLEACLLYPYEVNELKEQIV